MSRKNLEHVPASDLDQNPISQPAKLGLSSNPREVEVQSEIFCCGDSQAQYIKITRSLQSAEISCYIFL